MGFQLLKEPTYVAGNEYGLDLVSGEAKLDRARALSTETGILAESTSDDSSSRSS